MHLSKGVACALCGVLLFAHIPPFVTSHPFKHPSLSEAVHHVDLSHLPERPIDPSRFRTIDVAPVYTTGTSTSTGFIKIH